MSRFLFPWIPNCCQALSIQPVQHPEAPLKASGGCAIFGTDSLHLSVSVYLASILQQVPEVKVRRTKVQARHNPCPEGKQKQKFRDPHLIVQLIFFNQNYGILYLFRKLSHRQKDNIFQHKRSLKGHSCPSAHSWSET